MLKAPTSASTIKNLRYHAKQVSKHGKSKSRCDIGMVVCKDHNRLTESSSTYLDTMFNVHLAECLLINSLNSFLLSSISMHCENSRRLVDSSSVGEYITGVTVTGQVCCLHQTQKPGRHLSPAISCQHHQPWRHPDPVEHCTWPCTEH